LEADRRIVSALMVWLVSGEGLGELLCIDTDADSKIVRAFVLGMA
jgi:hypothetical protein